MKTLLNPVRMFIKHELWSKSHSICTDKIEPQVRSDGRMVFHYDVNRVILRETLDPIKAGMITE